MDIGILVIFANFDIYGLINMPIKSGRNYELMITKSVFAFKLIS